jgi:hypothetical protein
MSCDKFDPQCKGCRPALVDANTGEVFSSTHPLMMIVNSVWDAASIEEQEAFWKVTVKNSRDPEDLALTEVLNTRIQDKMRN